MNAEFRLWGFAGELQGNEGRLQFALPLFTRSDADDVVYAARVLDWSPELPNSDVHRVPAARAGEYGQRLEVDLTIVPGAFVALFGPNLVSNLERLGMGLPRESTVQGFEIWILPKPEADLWASLLEGQARERFDTEILGGKVTDEARAALAVMRNIGVGRLRDHLLRALVLHSVGGDVDQYRRTLKLAAARLNEEPERLEQDVRHHVEALQWMPRPQPMWRAVGGSGFPARAALRKTNVIKAARTMDAISIEDIMATLRKEPATTRIVSKDPTEWIVRAEE